MKLRKEDRYSRIRHRYDDVIAGITDQEMFQEILDLLQYIDALHVEIDALKKGAAACETSEGHAVH